MLANGKKNGLEQVARACDEVPKCLILFSPKPKDIQLSMTEKERVYI